MARFTIEEFSDIVPNEKNTFMSNICSRIFTFENLTESSTEFLAVLNTTCKEWFMQAINHCTNLIFKAEDTSKTWFGQQIENIRVLIFPTAATSLASNLPHLKVYPEQLQSEDCSELFLETSADYINIAEKHSRCMEENFFFVRVLQAAAFVLFTALHYWCLRGKRESRQKPMDSTMNPDSDGVSNTKRHSISRYSLETQRADTQYLKVISGLDDLSTISITLTKNSLLTAFRSLMKLDPVIQRFTNDVPIQPLKKNRAYLLHKLSVFLNQTEKCYLIIDINLDVSDSDVSDSEEVCEMRTRVSAVDSVCGNTAGPSNVATSSVCSRASPGKRRTPRRHRSKTSKSICSRKIVQ